MKKGGFEEGHARVLMVADNEAPADKTAQVVLQTPCSQLGFKVNFRSVAHDAMYTSVLQRAEEEGQHLPERRLDQGLQRSAGDVPDVTFNGPIITSSEQLELAAAQRPEDQLDDREGRDDHRLRKQRAEAWGDVDKAIVKTAAAIPWLWDKQPNVRSKNVKGVIDKWNAAWNFSYSSVK